MLQSYHHRAKHAKLFVGFLRAQDHSDAKRRDDKAILHCFIPTLHSSASVIGLIVANQSDWEGIGAKN